MSDLNKIVEKLTKLKPIGSLPPDLPTNTVSFFPDPTWRYGEFQVDIGDYSDKERHLLRQDAINKTTWVAWNLPVGHVMTLCDHHQPRDPDKSVGDLNGLGASVDLVGTGRPESTDLRDCSMNDGVDCFFWRSVDLRYGAVELFKDLDFTGGRVTLFLSEWTPDKTYFLPGWDINDNMTSIRWRSIVDRQIVKFLEHPQGGGTDFNRVNGWGTTKEYADLRLVNFDDKVSAFNWAPVLPVQEVVQPIKLGAPSEEVGTSSNWGEVTNRGSEAQMFSVTLSLKETASLTASTSETHVAGVTTNLTTTVSGGLGPVEAEASFSLELKYEYTKNTTTEKQTTKEIGIEIHQEIKAEPFKQTIATMTATVGKVKEKTYETPAVRWYATQIGGSVLDTSNGLYRRDEMASITLAGGLASKVKIDIDVRPIPS